MHLHGKTVLVTAGARQLGRAIVLDLAASGANVVIHYRQAGSTWLTVAA